MLRKLLKIIIPAFIIHAYKNKKRKSKQAKRDALAKSGQLLTQNEIENALKDVGIKNGDVIMLHSSLSSLGNVENGAHTVINAILNCVGVDGTLVMPSFPAIGFNFDYLTSKPVFDIKNTPSKMGMITETFRKMDGVKRSFHPTDSVCAYGKEADYLVKDHFAQLTPYNNYSPFYKLVQLKAKLVLLGVQLETVTNFHTPEDAISDFKFPVYHTKEFVVKMIDENGKLQSMTTKVHNPVYSKKRKCNEFLQPFKAVGFAKEFKIGTANCLVVEADKMHEWLVENYKKGITIYTPFGESKN